MLIERHVSVYSGAIIRFNKLQETIYFVDFKLIDVDISSFFLNLFYGNMWRKNLRYEVAVVCRGRRYRVLVKAAPPLTKAAASTARHRNQGTAPTSTLYLRPRHTTATSYLIIFSPHIAVK